MLKRRHLYAKGRTVTHHPSKRQSYRVLLFHAYFDVDLDILWNTATTKLEPFIEQIDQIIRLEN